MTDPIRELPPPATEQDWAALHSFGGEFGGPAKRCLFDLRDRLAAVEARLAQVGVPATTADGLSPVEPAPQAPQGVTVEELACILREAPIGALGRAYWLLKHPRLGPLLRGEGAPVPVVLPEEPPALAWLLAHDFRYMQGRRDAWAAARAEVARQQGGHDHE